MIGPLHGQTALTLRGTKLSCGLTPHDLERKLLNLAMQNEKSPCARFAPSDASWLGNKTENSWWVRASFPLLAVWPWLI